MSTTILFLNFVCKAPFFKISTVYSFYFRPSGHDRLSQAIFRKAMCRDLGQKKFSPSAGIPVAMLRMAADF
jgi:hypothetical protein